MKRTIIWAVAAGALLVAANALVEATTGRTSCSLIEGRSLVTEDLVRMKLVFEGWANVQVSQRGRFLLASADKDGRTAAFVIDSRTGQFRADVDDDAGRIKLP
jgi:hypothetical protein